MEANPQNIKDEESMRRPLSFPNTNAAKDSSTASQRDIYESTTDTPVRSTEIISIESSNVVRDSVCIIDLFTDCKYTHHFWMDKVK